MSEDFLSVLKELPKNEINTLKKFALELADAAATVTCKYFKSDLGIDNKLSGNSFDPVTIADREAEKAIRTLIEAKYPDHNIHGEEFGFKETNSLFEWVLDPIDGTRAFISGLPTWGTLIALKYKNVPIIGVIDQPYLKERYLGWTTGAELNGTPISTRSGLALNKATISTTDAALFSEIDRPRFDKVLAQSRLIRYGLDCYAYAVLSAGFIDCVLETGLEPYDMMALIPLVRGAGGTATNWQGEAPGECGTLLAVGNQTLHSEVLTLLNN